MEFGDFNHGPYGDPDDQDEHGPVRASGQARSGRPASRGIAEAVLQLIMETDVEGIIGAGRHERSGERTTWRNGYRERALDVSVRADRPAAD